MTGMTAAHSSADVRAMCATEALATADWPRPLLRFWGSNGSNRCTAAAQAREATDSRGRRAVDRMAHVVRPQAVWSSRSWLRAERL